MDSLEIYASALAEQIESMTGDEGEPLDPVLHHHLTRYLYQTSNPKLRPCAPSAQLPGTSEKVEVLRRRWQEGRELWHPKDATWESLDRLQQRVGRAPNGSIIRLELEVLGEAGHIYHEEDDD